MSSSQVKIGHYLLGETLGMGTFGKVKSKYSIWHNLICFKDCYWRENARFVGAVSDHFLRYMCVCLQIYDTGCFKCEHEQVEDVAENEHLRQQDIFK